MTREVRITVLVENTAQGAGLLAEHGLAYWIETGAESLLFDTGQGGVLAGNSFRLGVSSRQLDAIVLSHGHYDHTGGLADALRTNRPVRIFAHPAAFEPKFAHNRDGTSRDIGVPFPSRQAVRRASERLVSTERPTPVTDGLTVTGPVPRITPFEDTGGPFFLDQDCRTPDPLVDDQALFFSSAEGTVVLLGCAHAGVINTLQYIRQLTGNRPICAVLGGMHLVQASPERLCQTIDALRALGVEHLAPAHCTGLAATAALWNAFPGQCLPCHVGARFTFERASK